VTASEKVAKKSFVKDMFAWYSMRLSNRISRAIGNAKVGLCKVAIIGLEVPQPVFRLWLGPQVRLASRKRKGVSLIGMPKIELTSNDQIAVLIDPQCVVAQRVSVNGSILNCCIACTRERPMCIRYSHRSCMLTVKFWVSVTGTNSVPALHLG